MAQELKAVLQTCLSPDTDQQTRAREWLEQAQAADLPGYMVALANEMANPATDADIRRMAGTQLRQCLTARNEIGQEEKLARWRSFDPHMREHVKQCALKTLGTETGMSQAARVIARIATAEVEHGMWPTLMPTILQAVARPEATEGFRVAALETLGYICENIAPEHLAASADETLNAVVTCMRDPAQTFKVKKTATQALQHSLVFCEANFGRPEDRNHIMTVICETTQSPDEGVKVAALQCLVEVMQEYYRFMGDYMAAALFGITMDAMGSESTDDKVAMQGIEFWSTVCEEELDLQNEEAGGAAVGHTAGAPTGSQRYAQGALQTLTPRLLALMEKQDEMDDPSEWTVSKAACCCLDLLAQTVEDDVLGHVVPYVHQSLQSPAWQKRDTAVMAFGAVLQGPNEKTLEPLIQQALPPLMTLMQDPVAAVRDSLAWVLGRICDILPQSVCGPMLVPVTQCLMLGLDMEPRVATNVCWAFEPLSDAAYQHAEEQAQAAGAEVTTYGLSGAFAPIVEKLLQTTERPDAQQENLRAAAYAAAGAMFSSIPPDCYPILQQATPVVLARLQQAVASAAAAQGKEAVISHGEVQTHCCGLLQVIVRKLKKADAAQLAPSLMTLLVGVLQSPASNTDGVQEDALMLAGAIADSLDADFAPYMDHIKPFIGAGLTNLDAEEVLKISIALIGDFSRALGVAVLPHCDDFMTGLLAALRSEEMDSSVKPTVLSAFSDVALAIGVNFANYLAPCIEAINGASLAAARKVEGDDYDEIDDVNELRSGCLDAYTGIMAALKGDEAAPQTSQVQLIMGNVPHIVLFLEQLLLDPNLIEDSGGNQALLSSVIGLTGDMVKVFGAEMQKVLKPAFCLTLVQKGESLAKTKKIARWCKRELQQIGMQFPA